MTRRILALAALVAIILSIALLRTDSSVSAGGPGTIITPSGGTFFRGANLAVWTGEQATPAAVAREIEAQTPSLLVSVIWSQTDGAWQAYIPSAPTIVSTLKTVARNTALTVVLVPRPGFYGLLPNDGFHYSFAQGVAEEINNLARRENRVPEITVGMQVLALAEPYIRLIETSHNLQVTLNPDGSWPKYPVHNLDGTPVDRAARQGYTGRIREVQARRVDTFQATNFDFRFDPSDLVKAWLQSPDHRAVILDPGLTEIGVGCWQEEIPYDGPALPPNTPPLFRTISISCIADLGNP